MLLLFYVLLQCYQCCNLFVSSTWRMRMIAYTFYLQRLQHFYALSPTTQRESSALASQLSQAPNAAE